MGHVDERGEIIEGLSGDEAWQCLRLVVEDDREHDAALHTDDPPPSVSEDAPREVQAISHSDDCRILLADPSVSIPWSEVERGHWVRTCQCSQEHYRAPEPARVRLDPFDPATMRHLPQCEFRGTTDPAVLRVVLKVRDGADQSYKWVSCGGCDCSWPVSVYVRALIATGRHALP